MTEPMIPILGPQKEQPQNLYMSIAPATLGTLLTPTEDVNSIYQSYYRDYTQQSSVTPVPRVYGYQPYTEVGPRVTPVGPTAVFDAGLSTGITGRIYDMASSSLTGVMGGEASKVIDVAKFFADNETRLKSTEAGRYIWYNRYLAGAYDDVTQLGPLYTAMANDEVNYGYFKVIGQSSGAAETAALYSSYFADPTTIIAAVAGGTGAARLGFAPFAAAEASAIAQGVTREAVLHMSEPAHNYSDTVAGLVLDVTIGAALYGAGKFVGSRIAARGAKPVIPDVVAGENPITAGRYISDSARIDLGDEMLSRIQRSPDSSPEFVATNSDVARQMNYFDKNNPELARQKVPTSFEVDEYFGDISPKNEMLLSEYYAKRYTSLMEQELTKLSKSGGLNENLNIAELEASIQKKVFDEIVEFGQDIRVDGNKIITGVVKNPTGFSLVLADEPRFIFNSSTKTFEPTGVYAGLSMEQLASRGLVDEFSVAFLRSIAEVKGQTAVVNGATIVGPDLGEASFGKAFFENLGDEARKLRTPSPAQVIEGSQEAFVETVLQKTGIFNSKRFDGLMEWLGRSPRQNAIATAEAGGFVPEEALQSSSTAKVPMTREQFNKRLSKFIVNGFNLYVTAKITKNFLHDKLLLEGLLPSLPDNSMSVKQTISYEIATDPDMFRAMQFALQELPASKAKLSLQSNLQKQIDSGITSPEYVETFNRAVLELVATEVSKAISDALGLAPMTETILDSAAIAYNSLYTDIANYGSQLETLPDEEKNNLKYALMASYNILKRAGVSDPYKAAQFYGASVYNFSQSETFAKSYVYVLARFRNLKEGNMNGLNGIGAEKAAMLNIGSVRAFYEDLIDGGTSPREALETPYMQNLSNDWLLERLQKSSGDDIQTPVYAPQDGPTLMSFYAAQIELKSKENSFGDLERDAVFNSLPIAPLLLLRKIRDKTENSVPKILPRDYKAFDTLRKTIAEKNVYNVLKKIEPKKGQSILKEIE